MEIATNYRPLDQPKSEFGEFNKACFLVVVRHCEHIFCNLTYINCDLVEDEKAINEGVEWQFKIILCVLPNRKCKFFQVDKATNQLIEWH